MYPVAKEESCTFVLSFQSPVEKRQISAKAYPSNNEMYHREMKVGFISLNRFREQCKLRNAENVALNVLDTSFPH